MLRKPTFQAKISSDNEEGKKILERDKNTRSRETKFSLNQRTTGEIKISHSSNSSSSRADIAFVSLGFTGVALLSLLLPSPHRTPSPVVCEISAGFVVGIERAWPWRGDIRRRSFARSRGKPLWQSQPLLLPPEACVSEMFFGRNCTAAAEGWFVRPCRSKFFWFCNAKFK